MSWSPPPAPRSSSQARLGAAGVRSSRTPSALRPGCSEVTVSFLSCIAKGGTAFSTYSSSRSQGKPARGKESLDLFFLQFHNNRFKGFRGWEDSGREKEKENDPEVLQPGLSRKFHFRATTRKQSCPWSQALSRRRSQASPSWGWESRFTWEL